MLYLLYLDPYHHDDPLFVQGLARALARAGTAAPPCVLLHGSESYAQRLLEAQGLAYDPADVTQSALIERAARETNQRLVGHLTDAVVSAVGMLGTDRGLLRTAPDGTLCLGRVAWLHEMAERRVVPVIAALIHTGQGEVREPSLPETALCLARALGAEAVRVAFFTKNNRPGLFDGAAHRAQVPLDEALSAASVPAQAALRRVVEAGLSAWLTSPLGLAAADGPRGTTVTA